MMQTKAFGKTVGMARHFGLSNRCFTSSGKRDLSIQAFALVESVRSHCLATFSITLLRALSSVKASVHGAAISGYREEIAFTKPWTALCLTLESVRVVSHRPAPVGSFGPQL